MRGPKTGPRVRQFCTNLSRLSPFQPSEDLPRIVRKQCLDEMTDGGAVRLFPFPAAFQVLHGVRRWPVQIQFLTTGQAGKVPHAHSHREVLACNVAALSLLDGNADAGIYQNPKEIGRAAIQLIISLIHHNERGLPEICRELLVERHWVDGNTLPPKPTDIQPSD